MSRRDKKKTSKANVEVKTAEKILSPEPKIILCMIIGNEEKIIERCLTAAMKVVDGISICCNGKDRSENIVKRFLKEREEILPGQIVRHEWKNFSYNRSLSFDETKKFARENNFDLENTFALFLDADMVLEVLPGFSKRDLTADGYLINQYHYEMIYPNIRLSKLSCNWVCKGVTHEVWVIKRLRNENNQKYHPKTYKDREFYDKLQIDDRNDGGSKSDKFDRDIRLLSQELLEKPNKERYVFYLAQSYKCKMGDISDHIKCVDCRKLEDDALLNYKKSKKDCTKCAGRDDFYVEDCEECQKRNQDYWAKTREFNKECEKCTESTKDVPLIKRELFDLALSKYKQRVDIYREKYNQGKYPWIGEAWYSLYMIGIMYRDRDEWTNAYEHFLEAYQLDPTRPESIYEIAHYYRNHGKNKIGHIFAALGARMEKPVSNNLFIDPTVYEYKFFEELAICSYYTQFKTDGIEACEKIINSPHVPSRVREYMKNNEIFYVKRLPYKFSKCIEFETPLIKENSTERYRLLNPSIIEGSNGYLINCRCVNYDHIEGKYPVIDDDKIVRTKNFLIKVNPQFEMVSKTEIIDKLEYTRHRGRPIIGLDDCRLFAKNGKFWFTCNNMETHPSGTPTISLCSLEGNSFNREKTNIDSLKVIDSPTGDPNLCEKNWLPFEYQGKFCAIHSHDPIRVISMDPRTGKVSVISEKKHGLELSRLRGGAGPINFILDDKKGYLTITHEVIFEDKEASDGSKYTNRIYLHRFVWFDSTFQLGALSFPFYFEKIGVEFCAGMCYDHQRTNILLTVGIDDSSAYIYSIPTVSVYNFLSPLEDFLCPKYL
jgi:tetratricopeptide (TPR) repeat protein